MGRIVFATTQGSTGNRYEDEIPRWQWESYDAFIRGFGPDSLVAHFFDGRAAQHGWHTEAVGCQVLVTKGWHQLRDWHVTARLQWVDENGYVFDPDMISNVFEMRMIQPTAI